MYYFLKKNIVIHSTVDSYNSTPTQYTGTYSYTDDIR